MRIGKIDNPMVDEGTKQVSMVPIEDNFPLCGLSVGHMFLNVRIKPSRNHRSPVFGMWVTNARNFHPRDVSPNPAAQFLP